jgi:hypothetical protein
MKSSSSIDLPYFFPIYFDHGVSIKYRPAATRIISSFLLIPPHTAHRPSSATTTTQVKAANIQPGAASREHQNKSNDVERAGRTGRPEYWWWSMIVVVTGGGDVDDDDGSGRSDDFYYDENYYYFDYDRLVSNVNGRSNSQWMARQAPLSFSLMSSYYYY